MIQVTFSKKVLVKKVLANSKDNFSAFKQLVNEWRAVFSASKELAAEIKAKHPSAKDFQNEINTLFHQNPVFADERTVNYWIIKTNGYKGENVSKKESEIEVQNGICSLNFYEAYNKPYVIGDSEYAVRVKELVEHLAQTNLKVLQLSEEFFKNADTDHSGAVTSEEFEAYLKPIIPDGVDVHQLFLDFDEDKNGALSLGELGHITGKILTLNVHEYYQV